MALTMTELLERTARRALAELLSVRNVECEGARTRPMARLNAYALVLDDLTGMEGTGNAYITLHDVVNDAPEGATAESLLVTLAETMDLTCGLVTTVGDTEVLLAEAVGVAQAVATITPEGILA